MLKRRKIKSPVILKKKKTSILKRRKKKKEMPESTQWYWYKILPDKTLCAVCDEKLLDEKPKEYFGHHPLTGDRMFKHPQCGTWHGDGREWYAKFGLPDINKENLLLQEWINSEGNSERWEDYIERAHPLKLMRRVDKLKKEPVLKLRKRK